jgi:hypothetical protein
VSFLLTGYISGIGIALALGQFPLYGAIIGTCVGVGRRAWIMAVAVILAIHMGAMVACDCLSQFS